MSNIRSFEENVTKLLNLSENSNNYFLLKKTLDFVVIVHYNHLLFNGDSLIDHSISVSSILLNEVKIFDIDIICAALLHDVFEKSDINKDYFKEIFGEKIFFMVDILTKHHYLGINERERTINYVKRIKEAGIECSIIKLADRLDKLRRLVKTNNEKTENYINDTAQIYSILANNSNDMRVIMLWKMINDVINKIN